MTRVIVGEGLQTLTGWMVKCEVAATLRSTKCFMLVAGHT